MTHACCPACRLRIHATSVEAGPCPGCGAPLTDAPAADVLGLRLVGAPDRDGLAAAVAAVALPRPGDPS